MGREVGDLGAARVQARFGAAAAVVSAIRMLVLFHGMPASIVAAGFELFLAWAIWRKMSRVAAVLELLAQLLGTVLLMAGKPSTLAVAFSLALLIAFLFGVRGTFAYHRLAGSAA